MSVASSDGLALQMSSDSIDRFLRENGMDLSLHTPSGSGDDDDLSLLRAGGHPHDEPLSLDDFAPPRSSSSTTSPPAHATGAMHEHSSESSLRFGSLIRASQGSMFESKTQDEPPALRGPPYSQLPRHRASESASRPSIPHSAEPLRRQSSTSSRSTVPRDVPVRRVLSLASTSSNASHERQAESGLRAVSWSGLQASSSSSSGSERMHRDELDDPLSEPGSVFVATPPPGPPRTSPPPLRTALAPLQTSPTRLVTPPTRSPSPQRASTPDDEWSTLTTLLLQHGLPRVDFVPADAAGCAVVPEKASLISVVHDLVSQLERRGQIIQDLVLDATRNTKEQSKTESHVHLHEKKIADLTSSLAVAHADIKQLQRERDALKTKTDQDARTWKVQRAKLEQQVKVSEHRVKAKELLIDRMQHKIQSQMDKDELAKSRDKSLFQKFTQREPRKNSASDHQTIELIRMYETQRASMADEIASLQAQVRDLCADVRAKENKAPVVGAGAPEHVLLERFEVARREQERAASMLRQRESRIQDQIGTIEAELRHTKASLKELQDENANLHLEVESRPTIPAFKAAQRRIHQLERQLADHKLAMDEAKDLDELRKHTGTAALIQRDRLNAKLALNRLNALPRETAVEIVKEVCRELDLSDVTLIVPSLRKLCVVVQAVPRMERFIRDVTAVVGGVALEAVVPSLQKMQAELQELATLRSFRQAILQTLQKRAGAVTTPDAPETTEANVTSVVHRRALATIGELVEFETHFLQDKEMYTHALHNVENRPDVLVNKMVQHFRHLFGVKTMEGVFPKINEVFLFVNKMNSALDELKTTLQLPPSTSVTATLAALQDKVGASTPTASDRPPKLSENYVVDRRSENDVVGLQQVRLYCHIIKQLKEELGATTDDEIVPRTKRLMELLSLSLHTTQP
ncbi:hypothetical protein SPRG_11125 [Saprolegnia parasitica CBS 223.65]|uniref:Centrosomal protein of 70 kDa n=1 Tax=Saprolegnia parasitica (strain CBS 223.65) TaxID=695850 RepID=A0A067CA78_SAPPC|nr:hypothetical protein SPRG_11125 [Saprolegnia parasitica CBS 223.65]KDO23677.1 hypothetical protein SPRG_11125 [Saprolegnia parasitica CBS 223.65]|eukprot:XP_012205660.1 hypothetical protein SPRG_11125 [Saprolegnia parasitica CBS 223.65]